MPAKDTSASGNVNLKPLYEKSATAKAIFRCLSERDRARSYTNLKLLRNELVNAGKKVDEADFDEVFEKLAELGIGKIVYGTRGKANQFYWNFNMKEVGLSAIKGKNTIDLSGAIEDIENRSEAKTYEEPYSPPSRRVTAPKVQQQQGSVNTSGPRIVIELPAHFTIEDVTQLLRQLSSSQD